MTEVDQVALPLPLNSRTLRANQKHPSFLCAVYTPPEAKMKSHKIPVVGGAGGNQTLPGQV